MMRADSGNGSDGDLGYCYLGGFDNHVDLGSLPLLRDVVDWEDSEDEFGPWCSRLPEENMVVTYFDRTGSFDLVVDEFGKPALHWRKDAGGALSTY